MASHRLFSFAFALGIVLTGAVFFPARSAAQSSEPSLDAAGCPNRTIFPKLVTAVVVSCEKADSAEVTMPLKPDDQGVSREKAVRGAYDFREYQIPQADQQEQAFQSLLQLAPMAGFTVKYSDNASTITARKGDTWVLLSVSGEYYDVKVVQAVEAAWIPARNAQDISREMEAHRRVAIYGIVFSSDNQAVVEEKSKILAEVLAYLTANPEWNVAVESHKMSDSGTAEEDKEITAKRAKAVADWLIAHGVAAGRLQAKALGRTNPITENDTSQEIQRNERIELAKIAP